MIEETRRRLGRDEIVLAMADLISEDPLQDIGGAPRTAWYARILGEAERPELDDSELWSELRDVAPGGRRGAAPIR